MYKIHPSLLEDFRIMRAEIFEKQVADFIARVKGEFIPSRAMEIGTLIHQFLESGVTQLGEIKLMDEEIRQLDFIKDEIGYWISEVPFTLKLTDEILISGRVDKVCGINGAEIKTGSRFWGVDFYENSIQWRCYCLGLDLKRFTYFHIAITGTAQP
jgi:hypothetical protein